MQTTLKRPLATTLLLLLIALIMPCTPLAATGIGSYSEPPLGLVDGKNTTFVLRYLPDTDVAPIIYRDGIRLVNGIDFIISGRIVNFSKAPLPGDVLRVDYQASSRSVSNALPTESFTPNTAEMASMVGFTRAVARQLLQGEIDAKQNRELPFQRKLDTPALTDNGGQEVPESLKHLSQSLVSPVPSGKKHHKLTQLLLRDAIAQRTEDIGDDKGLSQVDTNGLPLLDERNKGIGLPVLPKETGGSASPESLRLLAERLRSVDNNVSKSKESKKLRKVKSSDVDIDAIEQ